MTFGWNLGDLHSHKAKNCVNLPEFFAAPNYRCHNKRPMGHIAHLRKQFKSIIKTLIKRRKKNIINFMSLFFLLLKKLEFPSSKDALCWDWLKLAQWFWRRGFFNFVNVFSLFCNYLSLEKGGALHLNKLTFPSSIRMLCAKFCWNWPTVVSEKKIIKFRQCFFTISWLFPLGKEWGPSFEQTWIPFTQGCFVPSLVEIGPVFFEKKIFLILSMYFHYFVIISPWKMAGPFIWTNVNPLHPRMLCANFGWN